MKRTIFCVALILCMAIMAGCAAQASGKTQTPISAKTELTSAQEADDTAEVVTALLPSQTVEENSKTEDSADAPRPVERAETSENADNAAEKQPTTAETAPPTTPEQVAIPTPAPEDKPAPAPTPAPTQKPAKKQEEEKMATVGIVMGSDSDMPVMAKAAEMLDRFGIDYEMKIISAHREPDIFFEWAKGAKERGIKVIIAGAGKAAHLPGMCAALFPMPVIGVPMSGKNLDGMDALYSIVQMPPGIPVATVAIDGGMNAAILAAKILAVSDEEVLKKLKDYSAEMKDTVQAKADRLAEVGYEEYLK